MMEINNYILENDILFRILLNENEENFIYKDEMLEEEIEVVGPHNLKIYKVLATRFIDGQLYGYIKGQHELGWTKLKSSLYVYNKPDTFVWIKDDKSIQNEVNQKFNMIKWFKSDVINKFLISKGLIKINNQYFEVLYNKKTLLGFIEPKNLDVASRIDIPVNIKKEGEFYLESSLSNKVENVNEDENFNAQIFFPEKGLVKLTSENLIYWTNIKSLNNESQNKLHNESGHYDATKDIELNDVIFNFLEERKKSKKLLISMIKEKINGIDESSRMTNNSESLNLRYKNLKNSKLGQLQIKYWNFRKKWRKNRG